MMWFLGFCYAMIGGGLGMGFASANWDELKGEGKPTWYILADSSALFAIMLTIWPAAILAGITYGAIKESSK